MSNQEAPEENPLQTLYLDLNKACNLNEYDRVCKISERILKKYPGEFKAYHCKVVAQIQVNSFESALKLINSVEDHKNELLFEKAYCEYRLNNMEESLETINQSSETDLRIQELKCQILYKLENYEESLKEYKKLIRNMNDSYEDERNVNMIANSAAMKQWQNKSRPMPEVPENIFDVLVNKACYKAANGNYEEALKTLKDAENICLKTFEDDEATQAEIDEELCAIKIQQAYCYQKLNQNQEANTLYHEVLRKRCGESHLLAVAANNVVCINKDQNVFDSKKKIKIATTENVLPKLILGQRQEIIMNQCLFSYFSNQGESVKSISTTFLKDNPKCVRAALITTAQYVREKQIPKAISYLENYLDIIDKTDINDDDLIKVQLCLAQLHLSQSSVSKCYELLSDLPISYLHKFGVLSTRVALCMVLEDSNSAIECFDNTLEWYKAESNAAMKGEPQKIWKEKYFNLLKISAAFCEKYKMPKEAAKYYKELLKLKPNDQSILASLIAAYSRFDKDLAEKTSLQLKDDKTLPEVDVDSLESAFIFGAKHMKKLLKGETTPGKTSPDSNVPVKQIVTTSAGGDLKKRSKKKKNKLPKNLDPGKIADPERWLPKRERSYFKGRKRDKRTNIMRGPQGATGGGSEFDASKKSTGTSSIPQTPNAEPLKSSGNNGAASIGTTAPGSSVATNSVASNAANIQPKPKPNAFAKQKKHGGKKKKR